MRLRRGGLEVLCVGVILSAFRHSFGACSLQAADASLREEKGESQGPPECCSPTGASAPESKLPLLSLQEVCGGPEDLSDCDFVRDGICILSPGYLRLWKRRRWREQDLTRSSPEPRWVEGLRIRTGGDIEVQGAVIQCTQAARLWGRPAAKRRRLRVRRPLEAGRGLPLKQDNPTGFRGKSKGKDVSAQRIELCARGSIRLLGPTRLHCTETVLWAGDSVTIAETSEVTASGTAIWRGLSPHTKTSNGYFGPESGISANAASLSLESVVDRLRSSLAAASRANENPLEASAASAVAHSPSEVGSAAGEVKDSEAVAGGDHEARQKPEIRGGSHGGLGGVATDRCEATAFSHPLQPPREIRGDIFLPLVKGEAGLVYPPRPSSSNGRTSGSQVLPLGLNGRGVVPQDIASVQPPRGGGLVAIIALRRLVVDGQVTSSGEPGWGCEALKEIPGGRQQRSGEAGGPKLASGAIRAARGLKDQIRKLLGLPSADRAPVLNRTPGPATATCATGGSGGSIVLVADALSFASPIRNGQVVAAGGGCLRNPVEKGRSQFPGSADASEAVGEECAAGGGGRIVIYANQPHPLDPVVVAPGGCTLQSSRLDLLPCLCGGGGTIFSRVHRRLVVANRLSSIIAAAAAASPPREAEEKRHYFESEKSRKKGREGDAWGPRAGPETAEPAETSLETPSAEGRSTAPASGLDALAVLSVQPTPLPVPLYAPTITLAVEAAVVAFGGFGGKANAGLAQPETATAKPVQEETRISKEPKVVVGSLLLHGGTRGSALHVLTPLHLHAAEGSIRLKHRSALVLAPCGAGSADAAQDAPGMPSCDLSNLPVAGELLGASVVLSSAASISLGEEASIRIVPALRSFRCSREPGDASSLPQPATSEGSALGMALLAGERLLLHGILGLTAAPSDCLPALPKKTPVLLFGAREVFLRGTQELDRIVLLSQGTATLAGTCTAGPPHRCSAELTPLFSEESESAEDPLGHSALCSGLEAFASARVASQLQATTEAGELQLPFDKTKGPQTNCEGLPGTEEASLSSIRPPAGAGGVPLSTSARPSDMWESPFLPPGPDKERWGSATWVQRGLRAVSPFFPDRLSKKAVSLSCSGTSKPQLVAQRVLRVKHAESLADFFLERAQKKKANFLVHVWDAPLLYRRYKMSCPTLT